MSHVSGVEAFWFCFALVAKGVRPCSLLFFVLLAMIVFELKCVAKYQASVIFYFEERNWKLNVVEEKKLCHTFNDDFWCKRKANVKYSRISYSGISFFSSSTSSPRHIWISTNKIADRNRRQFHSWKEIFDSKTKMSSTKKMSIFVLQPHGLHSQWQGEKLNSVFQVSFPSDDDEMNILVIVVISYLNQVILNHIWLMKKIWWKWKI